MRHFPKLVNIVLLPERRAKTKKRKQASKQAARQASRQAGSTHKTKPRTLIPVLCGLSSARVKACVCVWVIASNQEEGVRGRRGLKQG